jgi:hypothetical protein
VFCRECSGGKCKDTGRKQLECVGCFGKGCDHCNQGGSIILEGCAKQQAGALGQAITLMDMADKGHLPVSGGVLDQSAWFIEAYRFYSADIEQIRAERIQA